MILDEEWLDFFKENHFLVGISLDGNEYIHNQMRVKGKEPTFHKVFQHIQQMKKKKIDYNILTVITRQMIPYAKEIYEFYKQQNFQYIQFIPCLPELDNSTDQY